MRTGASCGSRGQTGGHCRESAGRAPSFPMASIRWSLAMRFCAAAGAVTLAAAVLAAIAALVEGHAPQPRAVAQLAVPLGACLGAAWTLSAWRAEGGDIALAALGARPASTVWLLLALAAPLLAWAPGAARDASAWSLSAEPAALTVQSPG
ncbi:MAG: hypothetical protein KC620_01770, partial [Myxococcales bacterium]|nr:hypothetical protein [Myxococcales bacterium]